MYKRPNSPAAILSDVCPIYALSMSASCPLCVRPLPRHVPPLRPLPAAQKGEAALIAAAEGGHEQCVAVLVAAGADCHARTDVRCLCLTLALIRSIRFTRSSSGAAINGQKFLNSPQTLC